MPDAIHVYIYAFIQVIFGGFSAEAMAGRLMDSRYTVVGVLSVVAFLLREIILANYQILLLLKKKGKNKIESSLYWPFYCKVISIVPFYSKVIYAP